MDNPKPFQQTDTASLHALIEAHAFGVLVASGPEGVPELAHLPFLLEREAGPYGTLVCHVARPNPVWRLAQEGRPLVAVFSGPHGYVSPRWYTTPHGQVPTWNYAVVHAHGRAEVVTDRDALLGMLEALSRTYEAGAEAPWRMEDMDAGLREQLLGGIVGLRLRIERLEGKFKLSQNRKPEDHAGVVRGLQALGGPEAEALARLMQRRRP
jgi:transcriptional regulator